MLIQTTLGEMDDALLLKRADVMENEDQRASAVEYCLRDCEGVAHQTGVAQGAGCFCERHIHRSLEVTVKRGPLVGSGVLNSFA